MVSLFAYGTLKEAHIQSQVIGRLIQGITDVLPGFALSSLRQEGDSYPLVVPKENSQVDGLVLEVTEAELEKIDYYEGEEYQRVKLALQSGKKAWVYVAAPTLQAQ